MANILLLQLDGKLPNLALAAIARHHRERGDAVALRQARTPQAASLDLFDAPPSCVYASAIFTKTAPVVRAVRQQFPEAIIGGTGTVVGRTLEEYGIDSSQHDFSDWPAFRQSMGFSQRGCRLSCGFCVVPEKEGPVKDCRTISELWRGDPWPRELILLDNDFFGSPTWRDKIAEIRAGRFKVSFSQGINARMLSEEAAAAIASVDYRNDSMKRPCIHCAWDNLGDEKPLFRGLNALVRHGVKPDNITVYMLIGYESPMLTEPDFERQRKLREFGCRPYPMPFVRSRELVRFQTWVVGAYDKRIPWSEWWKAGGRPEKVARRLPLELFTTAGQAL